MALVKLIFLIHWVNVSVVENVALHTSCAWGSPKANVFICRNSGKAVPSRVHIEVNYCRPFSATLPVRVLDVTDRVQLSYGSCIRAVSV